MAPEFTFADDDQFTEGDLVAIEVTDSAGRAVSIMGQVALLGRTVIVRQFAIYGANVGPGGVGMVELRRMARAAMEEYDVDTIRIEGARRTSGAHPGRTVKALTFRRRRTD